MTDRLSRMISYLEIHGFPLELKWTLPPDASGCRWAAKVSSGHNIMLSGSAERSSGYPLLAAENAIAVALSEMFAKWDNYRTENALPNHVRPYPEKEAIREGFLHADGSAVLMLDPVRA